MKFDQNVHPITNRSSIECAGACTALGDSRCRMYRWQEDTSTCQIGPTYDTTLEMDDSGVCVHLLDPNEG